MPYGPRTHGFLVYPKKRPEKLPAVVALHDHGEFFSYGKEKITKIPAEPEILKEYKRHYYGERSWATELAKRGFAVLAVDSFLWGSRRMPLDSVNEEMQSGFVGVDEGSEEYVQRYNEFWSNNECPLIVDSILNAGANWPGIFAYEDKRRLLAHAPRSRPDEGWVRWPIYGRPQNHLPIRTGPADKGCFLRRFHDHNVRRLAKQDQVPARPRLANVRSTPLLFT